MVITELQLAMAGAALGWLAATIFLIVMLRRGSALRHAAAEAEAQRSEIVAQTARLETMERTRADLSDAQDELYTLRRREAELLTRIEEREQAVQQTRAQLENEFRKMTSKLVREASDSLLRDAKQNFDKHHLAARHDAETYSKSVSDLLKPMRETLNRYESGLRDMRAQQAQAQGELSSQIKGLAQSANAVQAEARSLSTALRAGPKTRGRWGETTLRNVIEMAGLSQYSDFAEQYSVTSADNVRKQPDLIVRLPNNRMVAVDSKVSLNDWLDAAACEDETERAASLDRHGKNVWAHVTSLAAKDYAGALKKENALDIVVMFMPGETFFTAAIDARPTLFEDAYKRGVLIATPTTLIAILRSIAHAWRQQKANDSAKVVADMAQDLYDSLCTTGGLLMDLGRNLDRGINSYNKLIGNMETRVLPRARRLAELEMPGTEKPIEEIPQSESEARLPSETKDFEFPPSLPQQSASV